MLRKLFGFGKKEAVPVKGDAARLGVDLEMSYCPSCNEEYRLGVEQCVHCRVKLISGRERLRVLQDKERGFAARSMEIVEGEPLVAIRAGKLRDLKPYQILLARERVPARLSGESGGCTKG